MLCVRDIDRARGDAYLQQWKENLRLECHYGQRDGQDDPDARIRGDAVLQVLCFMIVNLKTSYSTAVLYLRLFGITVIAGTGHPAVEAFWPVVASEVYESGPEVGDRLRQHIQDDDNSNIVVDR
jgi:hypothetical protein